MLGNVDYNAELQAITPTAKQTNAAPCAVSVREIWWITMLAEVVMNYMGWSGAWFPSATYPDNREPGWSLWRCMVPRANSCYVGSWTGPDGDMLCVKPCSTNAEALRWKSPGGRFLIDATLRALWLRAAGSCGPSPRDGKRGKESRSSRGCVRHQTTASDGDSPPSGTSPGRSGFPT